MNKKDEKINDDLWCHYSNLPSPMSYSECADYDSMGNHGRFPKTRRRGNAGTILKIIRKIRSISMRPFRESQKI
jgi:hypothetical protein